MRHLFVWIVTAVSALIAGMATTAGAIVNPQPPPQDFTAGGGITAVPLLASTVAGLTDGSILLAAGPGRLQKVLVTVAGESWTFYDAAAIAASYTGDIIVGFVPTTAAPGTVVSFNMPTKSGIVAVPNASGTGAVTVSFN